MKIKKRILLFTIFLVSILFTIHLQPVFAGCSGSVSCQSDCVNVKTPQGCLDVCPPTIPGCVECSGTERSCTNTTESCNFADVQVGTSCAADCSSSGGNYAGGNCTYVAPPPPPPPVTLRYGCSGTSCVSMTNGAYTSSNCGGHCVISPPPRYACSSNRCVFSANGPFQNSSDCLASGCQTPPPPPKYSCSGTQCIYNPYGGYTVGNCNGDCSAAPIQQFACVNGSCQPSVGGAYQENTCSGLCAQLGGNDDDGGGSGSCMDEHQCGDPTQHDCCNGQCVPEGTQCGSTGCVEKIDTKTADLWFRVVSYENGKTIAWKGSQVNDPVYEATRTADGASVNSGNPAVSSWSVNGLDSQGYFQNFNVYSQGVNTGSEAPVKSFDKTKNRIDPQMNLTVTTESPTGTVTYNNGCHDMSVNMPDGPATPEHWANHLCGEGLAARPDTVSGGSTGSYLEAINTGCNNTRYAQMTGTSCQVGDDGKDNKRMWPMQDVDGCVSINELGGGGRPSNPGTVSTQLETINNVLRLADPIHPADLRYDEYWTMNVKSWAEYLGFKNIYSLVTLVPPAGYECKAIRGFREDTEISVQSPLQTDDAGCKFKINPGEANLFVIEITKLPVAKSCVIKLEDYVNHPGTLSSNLTIKPGAPFAVHMDGYSNELSAPAAEETRMWLEKSDLTQISSIPENLTLVSNGALNYYRYSIGYGAQQNCLTNASTPCSQTAVLNRSSDNLTGVLPLGTYKVHCDLPTNNATRCSGNPICSWNGQGGTDSCPAWKDCGAEDVATLNVVCTPNCVQADKVCSAVAYSDGCGNNTNCPADPNAGTPRQPTLTPASEYNMTSNTVPFQAGVTDASHVNQYEFIIYEDKPGGFASPDAALAAWGTNNPSLSPLNDGAYHATVTTGATLANLPIVPASDLYNNWRHLKAAVRTRNTICAAQSAWTTHDLDLIADFTGKFINDTAAGACLGTNEITEPLPRAGFTAESLLQLFDPTSNWGNSFVPITNVGGRTNYTAIRTPYTPLNSLFGWGKVQAQLIINNANNMDKAYICSPNCASTKQTANCSNEGKNCICTIPQAFGGTFFAADESTENANFYLQQYNLANGPWFQAIGGDLFSNGNMTSKTPNTCNSGVGCNRYLIKNETSGTLNSKSAGIPVVAQNSKIDTNGGYYSDGYVPDGSHNANARVQEENINTNTHQDLSTKENYSYFKSIIDVAVPATSDNSLNSITTPVTDQTKFAGISQLPSKLVEGSTSGNATYIAQVPGNLTLTLDSTNKWAVPDGQKWIIFVPGNLIIDGTQDHGALMTVAQGGFLQFIVKGNITFSANLGFSSDIPESEVTPVIEGVFIADGTLTVDTKAVVTPADNKFVGAGTFVGWTNIILKRNFADASGIKKAKHNKSPTELFIYRPDFAINIPDALRNPVLEWQEVN